MLALQHIGRYRVVGMLGSGSMGTVYLAVQEPIARQVAIKVLHPTLAHDPRLARRFLNEARAVNIVSHPGLVQVSDFGEVESGRPYIVMEFLPGETLRAHLVRRGGRLPVSEAVGLAADIADAVAAAHHKRIVHRDLKPENVMLVPDQAVARGARVKILDFGIAKVVSGGSGSLLDGEPTAVGTMLGTPTYMAPEQVQDAGVTNDRADVYALGIMLYEMLAGRVPFTGASFAVLTQQVQSPPPPLRNLAPEAPDRLTALVHAMLAKQPAARPAMARVAQELMRMQAPAQSAPVRGRSLALALAGALVLALLGVAIVSTRHPVKAVLPSPPLSCPRQALCRVTPPGLVHRLRALQGASGQALWAAGDQGVVVRGDGKTWTLVPAGTTRKLYAVWALGADEVWLAGAEGLLMHGRFGAFQAVPLPTRATVTALWRGGASDLWAATREGTLLRGDGVTFRAVPTGTQQPITAMIGAMIGAPSAAELWAVGRGGLLLRCNPSGCASVPSGTNETLHTVARGDSQELWLGGKGGALVVHDGSTGTVLNTQTDSDLNGLWLAPGGVLWVVGDQGTVLRVHTRDRAVAIVPSGTTEDLDSIWGSPEGDIYVGGTSGMLLHRQP